MIPKWLIVLPWAVVVSTEIPYFAVNPENKTLVCNKKNEDACQDFVDAMNVAHARRAAHKKKQQIVGIETICSDCSKAFKVCGTGYPPCK